MIFPPDRKEIETMKKLLTLLLTLCLMAVPFASLAEEGEEM